MRLIRDYTSLSSVYLCGSLKPCNNNSCYSDKTRLPFICEVCFGHSGFDLFSFLRALRENKSSPGDEIRAGESCKGSFYDLETRNLKSLDLYISGTNV